MSEFVECQNCGRRFFAENVVCPYCGGEDDTESMVLDVMRAVAPSTTPIAVERPARSAIFAVLFNGFAVLAVAIAVGTIALLPRMSSAAARAVAGLEIAFAFVAALGVLRYRRWARPTAIAFIAWNVTIAIAARAVFGVWASAPAALLLFVWPFLSKQARESFTH